MSTNPCPNCTHYAAEYPKVVWQMTNCRHGTPEAFTVRVVEREDNATFIEWATNKLDAMGGRAWRPVTPEFVGQYPDVFENMLGLFADRLADRRRERGAERL